MLFSSSLFFLFFYFLWKFFRIKILDLRYGYLKTYTKKSQLFSQTIHNNIFIYFSKSSFSIIPIYDFKMFPSLSISNVWGIEYRL